MDEAAKRFKASNVDNEEIDQDKDDQKFPKKKIEVPEEKAKDVQKLVKKEEEQNSEPESEPVEYGSENELRKIENLFVQGLKKAENLHLQGLKDSEEQAKAGEGPTESEDISKEELQAIQELLKPASD